MTLQTKHKLGITAVVVIAVLIALAASLGAFAVYHHYHVTAGSTDTGANPPADNAKTSDSVNIKKAGFTPPADAKLSEIVALAKETGVYSHYDDQYTNPISFNVNPFSHHIKGVTTNVFKHGDGTVYAVVESENTRTVEGIQCSEMILFQNNTGAKLTTNGTADACSGLDVRGSAGFNGFNKIFLINRTITTANTLNGSDTITLSKMGGTRASTNAGVIITATANEGGPQTSATQTAGTTSGTYNQVIITSHTYAFSNLKAAGTIITGVFLANNTSATSALDLSFAENSFTGVSVSNTDTLVITWTITFT